MSGKGSGKKRNRAAQSEQHGYQEPQVGHAAKPGAGEAGGGTQKTPEKQRVLEKMRELERRLQEQKKKE